MTNTQITPIIEERIKRGEEFVESMSVITEYIEKTQDEHSPNGLYYKKTAKILSLYRQMKFYTLTAMTNLSADQCHREVMDNDDGFNFFLEYEDLPMYGSKELSTVANVFDVYDFCGNTFSKKKLEEYLESRKLSLEIILSVLLEEILKIIKKRNVRVFNVIYTDYFNLETDGLEIKEKFEITGEHKDSYYGKRKEGISIFSQYLFSPLGGMDIGEFEEDKHKQFLYHLKEAANIAAETLKERGNT